ncbi:30S ribosomal protein S11 [Candidatus Peregrinibacteria bacterium]|nr:30S ribosomal protein S11 [Candidatus Peregrinibacteria bacterium]
MAEEKKQIAPEPQKGTESNVTADKKTKTAGKEKAAKAAKAPKKAAKTKRRSIPAGHAHIHAGFNNTIITITEPSGEVLVWASAGASGFKGTRKSTPYAAQIAAETAANKAKIFGMERVRVFVKGIGPGREQAIRGLHIAGFDIESITDMTPFPHGGCRVRRPRRV